MSKLFEVEVKEIEYFVEVVTYKNNQVFNKIINLLKLGKIFKVKEQNTTVESNKIYTLSGKVKGSRKDFVTMLLNEIISYLPDNFSNNYSFDFTGEELGYILSFVIHEMDEQKSKIPVSHRIREIRKDGSSRIAVQIIKR